MFAQAGSVQDESFVFLSLKIKQCRKSSSSKDYSLITQEYLSILAQMSIVLSFNPHELSPHPPYLLPSVSIKQNTFFLSGMSFNSECGL